MAQFPESLLKGYHNFLAAHQAEPLTLRRLAEEGQKPDIMLIGCCDSRAAPEIIFNMGPGEIFVTRNIANQVPLYQPDGHFHATSAALEYAVKALKVKHILVMGHSRCGGIEAALHAADTEEKESPAHADAADSAGQGGKDKRQARPAGGCGCADTGQAAAKAEPAKQTYDFIGDWLQLLKPAVAAVAANPLMTHYERRQALEQLSLRFSLDNLRSFPWIKAAEDAGEVNLHAAWFDIVSAELWRLDEPSGKFILLPGGSEA